MDLSDEAKRQALEAAQPIKDAARAQTLEAKTETIPEMEIGSPQTPGYQADYGETMKDAPELPQAGGSQTPDAPASLMTGGNSFEQALAEKFQEATPATVDNSHEIDR